MGKIEYVISVIMPVYNVEEYLADAVESIIRQTVGFVDSIQMILVNDGSTDRSGEICRQYAQKYPDNIVFIDKENGGVSSARNAGKRRATGEYISFLDPDDMWEESAFEQFLAFFDKHQNIGFASARMELFGRKNGFIHHLDYEYKKTRVVNITKTYDFPQFSAARTMFRASAIEDLWFDETLAIAEDMLFMNTLVLRDCKYGVVREAVYRYRRVAKSGSAIDNQWKKRGFYLDIIEKVHKKLIDVSLREYGEVIPYLQYMMMTDFRYRIIKPHEEVLTESELADYLNTIRQILLQTDDNIILENRGLSLVLKIDALRAKYGDEDFDSNRDLKGKILEKIRMTSSDTFQQGSEITITGAAFEKYLGDEYRIIAEDENGNKYESEYIKEDTGIYNRRFSSGTMTRYIRKTSLPSAENHIYRFYLEGEGLQTDSEKENSLRIAFGQRSKLSSVKGAYWLTDKTLVRATRDTVIVEKTNLFKNRIAEKEYLDSIRELAGADEAERRKRVRKALSKKNRPLRILVSESEEGAFNLMEFFTNLKSDENNCDIRVMCANYKATGKIPETVLINGDEEYKDLFIVADTVYLFDSCDRLRDPLGKNRKYYRDLAAAEIIDMYSQKELKEKAGELEDE